jgi:hypothetical protein
MFPQRHLIVVSCCSQFDLYQRHAEVVWRTQPTLSLELSHLLNSSQPVLIKPAASADREREQVPQNADCGNRNRFNGWCDEYFTGLSPCWRALQREQEHRMGLFARDSLRELRDSRRHEIHYLAQIDRDGALSPLSCIIWDISDSGARLTVADDQQAPDEFTLLLRRRCRVVRRYDGRVGVVFMRQ